MTDHFRSKLLIAAAFLASLCISAALVTSLWLVSLANYDENRPADCGEKGQSSQAELQWPISVVVSASRYANCIVDKADSQTETERDENDLNAQEDMALWAFGAMIFTGLGFVAAVVGVVYVRDTLFETRRIGRAQVRAYLAERKIDFEYRATKDAKHPWAIDIVVSWHNKGQSPALLCGMSTIPQIVQKGEVDQPILALIGACEQQELGTSVCATDRDIVSRGAALLSDEVTQWTNDEIEVVIYSRVAFRDVFGREHKAESCSLAVRAADNSGNSIVRFKTYPHHNSASYGG